MSNLLPSTALWKSDLMSVKHDRLAIKPSNILGTHQAVLFWFSR
ncbi:hypothetical protein O59_002939 [Cellvibrio sp. BR]|nr:hypothetical protein O59_002939 [Cellvibrio sp. BR]